MSEETVAVQTTPSDSIIKDPTAAEKALDIMSTGDLSKLTPAERASFLANMAKSLGLNPLTKPVDLIKNDKGQLITYYNKGATDQLRALHRVNLQIIERYVPGPNLYAVACRAIMPNGRQDEATGIVVLSQGMSPTDQANTYMKCETKAKRRVTLSILGLAMLDESELDTMPLFKATVEENAPRRLQAPPQAQSMEQVGALVVQHPNAAPSVSPEVQASVVAEPQNRPIASPVALPQAQVMKKRLPVAPPVVIK